MADVLATQPCHSHERPRWNLKLLIPARTNSGCCENLESKPVNGIFFFPSLCHCAFQINAQLHLTRSGTPHWCSTVVMARLCGAGSWGTYVELISFDTCDYFVEWGRAFNSTISWVRVISKNSTPIWLPSQRQPEPALSVVPALTLSSFFLTVMCITALAFLTSFFWQPFIARQLIYLVGAVFHHRFLSKIFFYQDVTLLKTRPSQCDFFIEVLWLWWVLPDGKYCSYSHWHWTLGLLSPIYLSARADSELFSEANPGSAWGLFAQFTSSLHPAWAPLFIDEDVRDAVCYTGCASIKISPPPATWSVYSPGSQWRAKLWRSCCLILNQHTTKSHLPMGMVFGSFSANSL